MENCRWIVIVGALVVGAALGTLVGYVFFSPEVPEGNARTVDVETAHAFILKYWETPTKETMVGCQISLGQIQAINTFLNETSGDSREVSGFRFYRAMDEENKAKVTHPGDCWTCFTCELNCPVRAVDVHPFRKPKPMAW